MPMNTAGESRKVVVVGAGDAGAAFADALLGEAEKERMARLENTDAKYPLGYLVVSVSARL